MGNTTPEIDITKLPKLPRVGSRSPSKVLMTVLPTAIASFIFVTGTAFILLARRKLQIMSYWKIGRLSLGHIGSHTKICSLPLKDLRIRMCWVQEDLGRCIKAYFQHLN